MIESIIETIEKILIPYGAMGVLIAAIIEEVIAPIPSALVVSGAGFILLKDAPLVIESFVKLFLIVAVPASIGATLGSLFVYGLAFWGGKKICNRYGKYLGFSWEDIEKAEKKFTARKADEIILFTVRSIPIIPSVAISAFCGLIRLKIGVYILFTFLGTLVRALILGFIGWQLGSAYKSTADHISKYETYIFIFAGLAIAAFIIYRIFKTRKSEKAANKP